MATEILSLFARSRRDEAPSKTTKTTKKTKTTAPKRASSAPCKKAVAPQQTVMPAPGQGPALVMAHGAFQVDPKADPMPVHWADGQHSGTLVDSDDEEEAAAWDSVFDTMDPEDALPEDPIVIEEEDGEDVEDDDDASKSEDVDYDTSMTVDDGEECRSQNFRQTEIPLATLLARQGRMQEPGEPAATRRDDERHRGPILSLDDDSWID